MEFSLRRAALIAATLILMTMTAPGAAQQVDPDSPRQESPTSVPPAPPPDLRNSASPTSPARHRWVDMGGGRRSDIRHRSSTRKALTRKAAPAARHSEKARPAAKQHGRAVKPLSTAELRRCKRLSSRQLRRNAKCEAALRDEQKPLRHKAQTTTSLSKAEVRRCHKMSYRQLLRNPDCAALLQQEIRTAERARRNKPPAAARHKKAVPSKAKRRTESAKGRRS